MKKRMTALFAPLSAVLLASAFPAIFLYCNNAQEADFVDIIPALLGFCLTGMAFFAVCVLATRGAFGLSAVIATVLVLLLTNFIYAEKVLRLVFGNLQYWHTIPIVLVLGLHVVFFLWRFLPKDLANDIAKVICLVFGVLIALNVVTNVPHMVSHMNDQRKIKSEVPADSGEVDVEKPNIYLFLFDEYANFPQMEEYYDYDNAPLRDFLAEHGFAVSRTGHNESIFTSTVTTNLANLEYMVDDESAPAYEAARKNGKLFSLMREHGYAVRTAESEELFGQTSLLEGKRSSTAVTANGESLSDIAIKQTILYPLWRLDARESMRSIMEVVECVSGEEAIPDGGTFTLVYLCFPHHPFFVDENGGPIPEVHSCDWKDKQYYLGQFKYCTKLMLRMLENVIENDPGAIIFLQSDHGARAYGLVTDVSFPVEVMSNPLNAVYYRGEPAPDIEGLSTVNTVRTVLNQLWDADFEMLEVPQAVRR